MHENARNLVETMRASTCLVIAKRCKENREVFAKLIKGLVEQEPYDRDGKSTEKERDHFAVTEVQLFNQVDTATTEETKMGSFSTYLLNALLKPVVIHSLGKLLSQ
jgi:hypothetical protein